MTTETVYYKKPGLLIFFIFSFLIQVCAQSPDWDKTVAGYIGKYKQVAIQDMQVYGIPASIKLAQAITESGAGLSQLATEANNHFGIKCHTEWSGKRYYLDDDSPDECFRKYDDPYDSFHDHSEFLVSRDRYSFLFSLDIRDYQAWAYGLKSAGYATNPNYPELLIKTIEKYQLYRYDTPETLVTESNTVTGGGTYSEIEDVAVYLAPGPGGRKVYLNNHIQFTVAKPGDDLDRIARDFQTTAKILMKNNDIKQHGRLNEDQIIYLQPKKRNGVQQFHVLAPGQTIWEVSQIYGIKLNNLYRQNGLKEGSEPSPGRMLHLR